MNTNISAKIVLVIKNQEIELSMEETKELKDLLCKLFGIEPLYITTAPTQIPSYVVSDFFITTSEGTRLWKK